jgi:hypothetical protein
MNLDGFGELSTVRIIRRQPHVSVQLRHSPPGLLEEIYPIVVEIVNNEEESIQAYIDVEFKNSTLTDSHGESEQIKVDYAPPNLNMFRTDTTSQIALLPSDLLKPENIDPSSPDYLSPLRSNSKAITGHSIGSVESGAQAEVPFWLRATHTAGERVLYVTVNYNVIPTSESKDTLSASILSLAEATIAANAANPDSPIYHFRKNEILRVPFSKPFEWKFGVHSKGINGLAVDSDAGILSQAFVNAPLTRSERWIVAGMVKSLSPFDLEVQSAEFETMAASQDGLQVSLQRVNPVSKLAGKCPIASQSTCLDINLGSQIGNQTIQQTTCTRPMLHIHCIQKNLRFRLAVC